MGRSIVFKERGEMLLLKFAQALEDVGIVEQMPRLEGKRMNIFIAPKPGKKWFQPNKYSKMPKVKTKSSAKKRFTLTGTGKIKRKHAFKSHILTKKSTKRKHNLTKAGLVHVADEGRVRDMLRIWFSELS